MSVRCGTYSGYITHRKNGEVADRACKAAKAAYDRAYRKANRYRIADQRRALPAQEATS